MMPKIAFVNFTLLNLETDSIYSLMSTVASVTAQKIKFHYKDFFRKYEQLCSHCSKN